MPNSVTNHTNFNMSGPVNLRNDSNQNPFGQAMLQQNQKAGITRDSNKSQQLIPDTNSTLAYTAAWGNSNVGGGPNKTGYK